VTEIHILPYLEEAANVNLAANDVIGETSFEENIEDVTGHNEITDYENTDNEYTGEITDNSDMDIEALDDRPIDDRVDLVQFYC
jgi:hypothetical protein